MSTSTLILSLKRFCVRRGLPQKLVSDNWKTFKAAAKVKVLSQTFKAAAKVKQS